MIPPPSTYGLPPKFAEWRPHQPDAAMRAIHTAKRFAAVVAPTGFGKMCVAETIARYTGRSCYLTVNKGLQDQIAREVEDRFDIRGRMNYTCNVLADQGLAGWRASAEQAADAGMCDACCLKDGPCAYYSRMRQVRGKRHVNTNYAKWLTGDEESFGRFDVLVCDEAHGAPEAISSHMRAEVRAELVERFTGRALPERMPIADWVKWAAGHLPGLNLKMETLKTSVQMGSRGKIRELKDARALVAALEALCAAADDPDGWVEDRAGGATGATGATDRVSFEPVWPRRYGERLFRGIGRVVLLSAAIRPKTLELMGVPADDVDFAEYPSSFPADRRPVIPIRTVVQRNGMSDDERLQAIRRVDQIIGMRLGRSGIIHTVSFDRARYILANSQYAHLMILNDQRARDIADRVGEFKRSRGRILVTPSVPEGYDFPGLECEWQVIYKVPLTNRHASEVADAKCKEDPEYDGYQAMQKIMQMSGRGMRSADDRCETLITDDTWGNWFWRQNRKFAAGWFADAVMESTTLLPKAAPGLG